MESVILGLHTERSVGQATYRAFLLMARTRACLSADIQSFFCLAEVRNPIPRLAIPPQASSSQSDLVPLFLTGSGMVLSWCC